MLQNNPIQGSTLGILHYFEQALVGRFVVDQPDKVWMVTDLFQSGQHIRTRAGDAGPIDLYRYDSTLFAIPATIDNTLAALAQHLFDQIMSEEHCSYSLRSARPRPVSSRRRSVAQCIQILRRNLGWAFSRVVVELGHN